MRKVPVIEAGDGKHPGDVEERRDCHSGPAPADPNYPHASKVEKNERERATKLELVGPGANRFGTIGKVIRIEPLPHGDEGTEPK
jgi:hypothetical protein